jgi:MoxR-like ATPase
MVFAPGPIFANIVLADEINRTPPKTQAALLEAMQEHRVTIQGRTYRLEEPFHVFATQNPIELEGTYPLPEAQLDRFMFQIIIEHLPETEEMDGGAHDDGHAGPRVRARRDGRRPGRVPALVRQGAGLGAGAALRGEPGAREPARRSTARPAAGRAPDFIKEWVSYGASVRAAQYLVLGGKARALMRGRTHVSFEDIRALAHPVLRHRILTNFHAESERVTTDRSSIGC